MDKRCFSSNAAGGMILIKLRHSADIAEADAPNLRNRFLQRSDLYDEGLLQVQLPQKLRCNEVADCGAASSIAIAL